MHFLALAVDYDGTIAENGSVPPEVCASLAALKHSGRKLLLITGRELQALKHHFAQLSLFDLVVAENGALLYDPTTDTEELIADPASTELVGRLREKGVSPLSVGRSVVATWHPFEEAVISTIRELGLELQISFNKDAIMILPSCVNKASGLSAALSRLGICELNVVGVGDAENDHAFLALCGCAAAVSNAIESIKARADICLTQDHGRGVCELIERLLQQDAALGMDSTTMKRFAAQQVCPQLYIRPQIAHLIARSRSASSSTMNASLPPSSMEDGFRFCPAHDARLRPAATLPVNATPRTRGSSTTCLDCSWDISRLV